MSCILMIVLSVISMLLLLLPLNLIVWAMGMRVLTKKSPLTGIVHELQRKISWLPEPNASKISHYWYRVKHANRKRFGHLPPEKLSSKLDASLNFVWHAPSRARMGARYRHEEHKRIHGFKDWTQHHATSLVYLSCNKPTGSQWQIRVD